MDVNVDVDADRPSFQAQAGGSVETETGQWHPLTEKISDI